MKSGFKDAPAARVEIREGCTLCGRCAAFAPQVFDLAVDGAFVRPGAEVASGPRIADVLAAADACNAQVIRCLPVRRASAAIAV